MGCSLLELVIQTLYVDGISLYFFTKSDINTRMSESIWFQFQTKVIGCVWEIQIKSTYHDTKDKMYLFMCIFDKGRKRTIFQRAEF